MTLNDRMLHQIEEQHLSRIIIVVGHEGQKLVNYIGALGIQTPIIYVNEPVYDKDNMCSLALAKGYLRQDDTLLLGSHIVFKDPIPEDLISDPCATEKRGRSDA